MAALGHVRRSGGTPALSGDRRGSVPRFRGDHGRKLGWQEPPGVSGFVAPPLPPFQPEWPDLQVWWQLVLQSISDVLADQQSQINDINAILDPNTLTPDKKPPWIFQYAVLTGEQSDLDSKATTYGITTEKTNYDNAISALTSYLAGLTTAVDWDDESGNTTIVASTFRSKFSDVLTKKQLLINKIAAQAKVLADAAQSTANTGVTNAAAAQSTAETVNRNDSISTSWTSPGTILSATDAGSNATISIANHTRKYTDVSSVSVTGGSVTGLAYSTTYYLYYDQTSRAGGSVTYHATTDPNVALPNAAAGRHYCGKIATPASGGSGTTGGVDAPGGGGGVQGGQIP
jgi:hypothetical protein